MTKKSENGKATVKDFSLVDKSGPEDGIRNDGSKDVDVSYAYEFNVLETTEELNAEFTEKDLLELANARLKATANSKARQNAIKIYAQDPNSPDAVKERMVKDAMKLDKFKNDEAGARNFVDSMLA